MLGDLAHLHQAADAILLILTGIQDGIAAAELMADFGRSAAPAVKDLVPGNEFVYAQRP